jgi:hypothetical protein
MARRPKARLITGDFDLHDVSFRTELRANQPSSLFRQRVPPFGSPTRQSILCSQQLWQKGKKGHKLRPEARISLGHAVQLSPIRGKGGKQRWKWSVESIMCSGVSKSLEEARVTALETVFRWLGSPHNYAAFQRMAKLAGHEFA